jgi:hypothetical protein
MEECLTITKKSSKNWLTLFVNTKEREYVEAEEPHLNLQRKYLKCRSAKDGVALENLGQFSNAIERL